MNKDNTHLMVQEQSITQLHDDDVFGEFQALWDEQNPCQVYVMALERGGSQR